METPENVEIKVTPKVTDSELDGMIGRAFIRILKAITYIAVSIYVNISPVIFMVFMFMLTVMNTSYTIHPVPVTPDDAIALSHMMMFVCVSAIGTLLKYGNFIDIFLNWVNPFKEE